MSSLVRLGLWLVFWVALANVLFEWSGLHLWQPLTFPKHTDQVSEFSRAEPVPDVVFVGSSLARSGFEAEVIEEVVREETGVLLDAHNFGIGGTHAVMVDSLLRSVPRRRQPRFLVYGTSMHAFHERYGHSVIRHILFYASPWELVSATMPGGTWYQRFELRLTALFRPFQLPFHWALRDHKVDSSPRSAPRSSLVWRRQRRREERVEVLGRHEIRDLSLLPEAWAALERMVSRTRRAGTRIAVVNMPIDPDHPDYPPMREALEGFAVLLERFCAARGVPYLDVDSGAIGLRRSDYRPDGIHFEPSGAVRLSRHVAQRLVVPLVTEGEGEGGTPALRAPTPGERDRGR